MAARSVESRRDQGVEALVEQGDELMAVHPAEFAEPAERAAEGHAEDGGDRRLGPQAGAVDASGVHVLFQRLDHPADEVSERSTAWRMGPGPPASMRAIITSAIWAGRS